jgi:di-N-acetylchitobiase
VAIQKLIAADTAPECPCSDKSLCRPTYVPKSDDANKTVRAKEVFGFVSDGAASHQQYDWDVVSTVAWVHDEQAMCEAHKHGARVVMSAPGFANQGATPFPANATARLKYINSAIKAAQLGHFDGVTFDYESAIAATDTGAMDLYIELIKETTAAFHKQVPGSQISVCVAWSPDDIDGRAYDYKRLADASDLLYLMVYDTRSQIYDQCLASANSPVPIAHRAIQRYTDIGVLPAKMILGIPWYSYDYPCNEEMESPTSKYCPIELVPFRGINCSDAAGGEREYGTIMKYINAGKGAAGGTLTGRLWDSSMQVRR